MIWITKDGRSIDVKDMSDAHLKNTVSMLKRAQDKDMDAAGSWADYAGRDNDGAYYAEQGMMDAFLRIDRRQRIVDAMTSELKRRKTQ